MLVAFDSGFLDLPDLSKKDWLSLFADIQKSENKSLILKRPAKGLLAFFEPSTRTLVSFESAGLDLGIRWVKLNAQDLSLQKGETLADTFRNLALYDFDFAVVRHSVAGVPHLVQSWMKIPVFNAGDGAHAHPTQAVADAYTLWKTRGSKSLQIAFFGDVLKSRVVRSDVKIFKALGHHVFVCDESRKEIKDFCAALDVSRIPRQKLKSMDAVVCLRTQKERGGETRLGALEESDLGSKTLLMHPAPVIVGEDLRFSLLSERGDKNLILMQARNAYWMRRYLMHEVLKK